MLENLPNQPYGPCGGSHGIHRSFSAAEYIQAVGSASRCDKGVAAGGSPLDPGRVVLEEVLIPFQHSALLSVTIRSISVVKSEPRWSALRSWGGITDRWAYCSTRGGFIISLSCLANGRRGPFFPPYRRQYHSSDLSPFACLNV